MPDDLSINIEGLQELIQKFDKLPNEVQQMMYKTMEESLRVAQEKTPGYPPKPSGSNYTRTGNLGKSLGQRGDKPTVYSIKGSGGNIEGRYGTDLSYAKYVIDPQRQAYMHKGWWWTMDVVKHMAEPGIKQKWDKLIEIIKNKLGL